MTVKFYNKSSEDMSEVVDGSIKFVLTSAANDTILNIQILNEIVRVLTDDGIFALNVGVPVTTWEKSHAEVLHPFKIADDLSQTINRSLVLRYDLVFAYNAEQVTQTISGLNERGENELGLGFLHVHEHVFVYSKPNRLALDRLLQRDKIIPSVLILPSESLKPIIKLKQADSAMPTPFNEAMVTFLLDIFTQEGDIVLDPMAGWGTLGKIAAHMRRDSILYELDPHIFGVARENWSR